MHTSFLPGRGIFSGSPQLWSQFSLDAETWNQLHQTHIVHVGPLCFGEKEGKWHQKYSQMASSSSLAPRLVFLSKILKSSFAHFSVQMFMKILREPLLLQLRTSGPQSIFFLEVIFKGLQQGSLYSWTRAKLLGHSQCPQQEKNN